MIRLKIQNLFRQANGSRGFSTIEVMIAIVLLGILTVAFFPSLLMASTSTARASVNQGAKNLAEIIMQEVMRLPYDPSSDEFTSSYNTNISMFIPSEYSAKGFTAQIKVYYPRDPDRNIQLIRVIVMNNSKIDRITVTNGGSGYSTAPAVTISGGGGSGAEAVAIVSAGVVTGVDLTNPGSGYTTLPTVSFSGGGGAGAEAEARVLPARILEGYKIN